MDNFGFGFLNNLLANALFRHSLDYSFDQHVITTLTILNCCFCLFVFQTLKPDPILSLKRVVGFGGGTFREVKLLLTRHSRL